MKQPPPPNDLPALNDKLLKVTRLDNVTPEKVSWLWPHRFPLGKLSLIAGVQGKGKSFLSLDMAARLTTGTPWPDCGTRRNPVSNVAILAAEDNPADTIRPRFDAMGGEAKRVLLIEGTRCHDEDDKVTDESITFNLQRDILALRGSLESNPNTKMLIIDPLTAYMPSDRDANKDADVRAVLHPLGALAAEMNIAVVGIVHLRKGTDAMDALHRVMGSNAFTAFARAVWFVTVDRDDPECRLFFPGKLSVAKAAPALRFRIDEPGVIQWLGESEANAEDAFDGGTAPVGRKVNEAMSFLYDMLGEGPQLAADVDAKAEEASISKATLKRARIRIKVRSFRESDKPGEPYWYRLAADDDATPAPILNHA